MTYSEDQIKQIKAWFVMGCTPRDVALLIDVNVDDFVADCEMNVQRMTDLPNQIDGPNPATIVKLNKIINDAKIRNLKRELFGL